MKRLLVALLFPAIATAHTQTPTSYGGSKNLQEAISVQDSKEVIFTVGNLNSKPMAFTVTVDGVPVSKTGVLHENKYQQVSVRLKTVEMKKPVTYRVCSLSDSGKVKTQVCSKVQLVRL